MPKTFYQSDLSSKQNPPCQYFGKCGGCQLQDLAPNAYSAHKLNIAKNILNQLNAADDILQPLVNIGQHQRRRVELKLALNKGKLLAGFYAPNSHKVIPINHCLVADESINNFIKLLNNYITDSAQLRHVKTINITNADNGLDILYNSSKPLKQGDTSTLLEVVSRETYLCNTNVIKTNTRHEPFVRFNNIQVQIPAGAFLQASKKAESAMCKIVKTHTVNYTKIADLFCGLGTYSFALHDTNKNIYSYEINPEAIYAMHNAIKTHNLNNINAEIRDLFKNPLTTQRLNNFDCVIINPPRAGALAQVKQLANSNVNKIIYVSCNPHSFTRDALVLEQGGYKLIELTPIDQFCWSKHLEVVGVFSL